MKYYVLNTQEESDQCRLKCYKALLKNNKSERFAELTKEWSPEQTRATDGKYIVPECSFIDSSEYLLEEPSITWFPEQKI